MVKTLKKRLKSRAALFFMEGSYREKLKKMTALEEGTRTLTVGYHA